MVGTRRALFECKVANPLHWFRSRTGSHATLMERASSLLALTGTVLVTAIISSCDGADHGMMTGTPPSPTRFQSNGERIYFTGTSESGTAITYTGGNMHLEMMGGGCATCHGADRRGARMMPEFWLGAPPLTRSALFGEHGAGHGDHAEYDAGTLQRAISSGLDPDGTELSPIMPRWSMSDADWRDLIAYLSQ